MSEQCRQTSSPVLLSGFFASLDLSGMATPRTHLDSLVDVFLVTFGHLANDIFGGGIDQVELLARHSVFPFIVDENLSEFDFRIRIGFHNFFFGENKIRRADQRKVERI